MKKIVMILGGIYHDFEGFASAISDLIDPSGYQLFSTYDLDPLLGLTTEQIDIVLSYTSLSKHRPGQNGRRITMREVGTLGAGSHIVTLGDGRMLSPGVYLLRLSQGTRSLTARAVVMR